MKLVALKFGIASAISAAVLWVICSAFVILMPEMMLSLSGDMLHMRLHDMGWHLTLAGVTKGLIAWCVVAGITGWLLAAIYNRLH